MKIPMSIIAMLAGILLTVISLWFGQHHGLMPVAASAEATEVDGLFDLMLIISIGLVLLVETTLVVAMIKFRRKPGDNSDGPPTHGNVPLEILWTALPAIIVLGIGVYSFEIYNTMGGLDTMASMDHSQQAHVTQRGSAIAATLPGDESMNHADPMPTETQVALGIGASPASQNQPPNLVVDVMGLQYAWVFNYPAQGVVAGELHLPLGQEVQLNITAQDVIHALWLPQFRLKQDAIPGRTAQLRFKPQRVGEYPVVCAELCGGYHGSMKTLLVVHPQEEFDAWVAQNQVASHPDLQGALAVNPATLSDSEFLAPYAAHLGMNDQILSTLPHHHSAVTP